MTSRIAMAARCLSLVLLLAGNVARAADPADLTPSSARPSAASPAAALTGTVVDAETGSPIASVTVTMDSVEVRRTDDSGLFSFDDPAPGEHVLTFEHVAYVRTTIRITRPGDDADGDAPLAVRMEPAQLLMQGIEVRGSRVLPLRQGNSTLLRASDIKATPGNIANDPMRTIQSQPSCASDGSDFLSKTAVRGGDTEEHGIYFDGYPLRHSVHAGGFAGVVYDGMLAGTVLVPGAAPLPSHGALSGLIMQEPHAADSTFGSFRYDITSIAGGVSRVVNPGLTLQGAAKSSFFNLPAYQEVGVKKRTFRDVLGRIVSRPGETLTMTTTLLGASDSEEARTGGGSRDVSSLLAGVDLAADRGRWEIGVRPYHSFYESRDDISSAALEGRHQLQETSLAARAERRDAVLGAGFYGEIGSSRHRGTGGDLRDTPFSAAATFEFKRRDALALTVGAGGSREPWTASFEPEAYASARVRLGAVATLSAEARRSHQSPFLFHERRYFASIPIDAGELRAAYAGSARGAPAVRMDQASMAAEVALPLRCSLGVNAFRRRYARLLTWNWESFPEVRDVRSDGKGRGDGYEIVFARDDPGTVSLMAAMARARTWKREGSLAEERPGDFDRPRSYQIGLSAKMSERFRITVRWMRVDGRPYTRHPNAGGAPDTHEINAERLPDFRRLDAKAVYTTSGDGYEADFFLDVLNVLDETNITAMYAVETSPGSFHSAGYGGTRFFPIVGGTLRW